MARRTEATTVCDCEAARLLPWYVTGRLDTADAARVETHLAACATCRDDVDQQRRLLGAMHDDERVEYSPQPSLDKLLTRIDELDRELPVAHVDTPVPAKPQHQRPGTTTRWLVAALVVQTFGLGTLGALLWQQSMPDEPSGLYRTLTSTTAATPANHAPRIRVVFAPGTNVAHMTGLLQQVGARIVDGPSEAGTYALELGVVAREDDFVATSVARLRADARIVFAEPILEASSPPPSSPPPSSPPQ